MAAKSATLVLLPGLDGTGVLFRPLLAALPDWIRPVPVAYPARGDNDYAALIETISSTIADAGPYWVLGWSFSGPLALMLAAREPERAHGVILCASFIRAPRRWPRALQFAVSGPLLWTFRVARRVPAFLRRHRNRELWRDKAETWRRVSARTLAARVRAILAVDASGLLRSCPAPVFYLAASRDEVVPADSVADILRVRPSVRVTTLEGPHLALYTHPMEAARAISALIEAGGG